MENKDLDPGGHRVVLEVPNNEGNTSAGQSIIEWGINVQHNPLYRQ